MELPLNVRIGWVDGSDERIISLNDQLILTGVSKTAYYYEPIPESEDNLHLMEAIDRIYMKRPYYGSRRMTVELDKLGFTVNRKRVRRLMRLMCIETLYPKPHLSKSSSDHKKYPYLLKDIVLVKPNQVLSTDITYIPLKGGFLYLTAVIDWFSRYVLSWRLSNTLDNSFCIECLEESFCYGYPEIFNTDQGTQYTAANFIKVLEDHKIKISMDGKGRALDNIFCERLWRSVKYEEVYLKQYESGIQAKAGLAKYFNFYNNERPHQSLNYKTPASVYFSLLAF